MTKKTFWIILIFLFALGFIVMTIFTDEDGYEDYAPNARAIKLADPDLLYASSSWSGLCSNERGEEGGCYSELYLYNSGKLVEEIGWEGANGEKSSSPSETYLGVAALAQVIKQLRDSGIMTKDCPPLEIMDAGWSYQVTLDGSTKTFDNPPDECEEIFDGIDLMIDPVEESQ